MEEVRDMQKRNYESDVVEGWEQKEEQFHLNQVGYPFALTVCFGFSFLSMKTKHCLD